MTMLLQRRCRVTAYRVKTTKIGVDLDIPIGRFGEFRIGINYRWLAAVPSYKVLLPNYFVRLPRCLHGEIQRVTAATDGPQCLGIAITIFCTTETEIADRRKVITVAREITDRPVDR